MIYCQPERNLKRSQGSRSGERQDCAMSGLRHQHERPWPAKVIEKKVEVTGRDANGKIDHGRAGPATLTNKSITCFCGSPFFVEYWPASHCKQVEDSARPRNAILSQSVETTWTFSARQGLASKKAPDLLHVFKADLLSMIVRVSQDRSIITLGSLADVICMLQGCQPSVSAYWPAMQSVQTIAPVNG